MHSCSLIKHGHAHCIAGLAQVGLGGEGGNRVLRIVAAVLHLGDALPNHTHATKYACNHVTMQPCNHMTNVRLPHPAVAPAGRSNTLDDAMIAPLMTR